jgi:hypothetical protein
MASPQPTNTSVSIQTTDFTLYPRLLTPYTIRSVRRQEGRTGEEEGIPLIGGVGSPKA